MWFCRHLSAPGLFKIVRDCIEDPVVSHKMPLTNDLMAPLAIFSRFSSLLQFEEATWGVDAKKRLIHNLKTLFWY